MHFDWTYFWHQLLRPNADFLDALALTVTMAVCAEVMGVILGLLFAQMRLSKLHLVSWIASIYIWAVRGTPLLVQIVFIYTGLAAAGIMRFNDVMLFGITISGSLQAGIVALGLHEGAYMAEIFRSGIQAVDTGQFEAAKALGLPPGMMMRHVVLPQALRVVLLPIGNQFNILLKNTTLVSVIGVAELMLVTETINSATFRTFELYSVLGFYFLMLTSIWTLFMKWAERKLALNSRSALTPQVTVLAQE